MMLLNDLREPEVDEPVPHAELPTALERALLAAREPAGGPRREAWRFHPLGPEVAAAVAWLAARRIEPAVGPEGARAAYEQWRAVPGWVVVTCLRADSDEQMEHDREACLTAAQRASLSLWSESIPSKWDPDLVADEPAFFELVGADPRREVPVGVLLYGHPERNVAPQTSGS